MKESGKRIMIKIRQLLEYPILEDMLYEAIYQPDENNPVPRNVIEIPAVNAYMKDFGSRKDDFCLVADIDGTIVGAVWIREMFRFLKNGK